MHPFLKRAETYQRLQRLYSGPNIDSLTFETDIFQINMVFAIGAVSLNRKGLHQTPAVSYYLSAMEHADTALGIITCEHIQNALLLLIFGSHHHVSSEFSMSRIFDQSLIQSSWESVGLCKTCYANMH